MTQSKKLRVLLADDQDLVRAGLKMILEAQPDIDVIAEAGNGRDAITKALHLRPDVCLIDIRMPELDGLEVTRQLAGPGVEDPLPVVIITTFDLDEYVTEALRSGARGFLVKDVSAELVVQAVRAAAAGDALISPSTTARLLDQFALRSETTPPAQPVEPLTDREEEITLGIGRGLTNAELAATLHVSLSTIKTHVNAVMRKVGSRNRVQLAIWAYETGRLPAAD